MSDITEALAVLNLTRDALRAEQAIEDDMRRRGMMGDREHTDRKADASRLRVAALAKADALLARGGGR